MRKIWSSTGLLAVASFFVWFTIIFARTQAFTALLDDPHRAFAIFGSAIAMVVFGIAIDRLFGQHDDE